MHYYILTLRDSSQALSAYPDSSYALAVMGNDYDLDIQIIDGENRIEARVYFPDNNGVYQFDSYVWIRPLEILSFGEPFADEVTAVRHMQEPEVLVGGMVEATHTPTWVVTAILLCMLIIIVGSIYILSQVMP